MISQVKSEERFNTALRPAPNRYNISNNSFFIGMAWNRRRGSVFGYG